MRLLKITATPHPGGNRIDLNWENPQPATYPGVMVRRREGTHPVSPTDGVLVAQGEGVTFASDESLKGETVYYYSFFPYLDEPPKYVIDKANRAAAMASGAYGHSGQLLELLPGIYHRYDTVLPENPPGTMAETDKERGQLRRFLDLPGCQFDVLYSLAKSILDIHDVTKVDGRLLPLLGQWIGWQSNLGLEYDAQRNEIRHAPEIYKTVGTLANLRALVNRITNWDSQIKEFAHNVFLSNDPERLNTWSQALLGGKWTAPEMVSLDYAYEGKPSSFRDNRGRQWLFYHTENNGRWHIRYKIFDRGKWSPGYRLTEGREIEKYPCALQVRDQNIWLFWCSYMPEKEKWAIKTAILSVGRDAVQARLPGKKSGPFALFAGATLIVQIDHGTPITVTFQAGDFEKIDAAKAAEVVAVLNRELYGATAAIDLEEKIVLSSDTAGAGSALQIIPASTAAAILGFDMLHKAQGQNALQAELAGHRQGPYKLAGGDQLMIRTETHTTAVSFYEADFPEGIGNAALSSVLTVLNRSLRGVTAEASAENTIRLRSESFGENALLSIDVDTSTAAPALGFGAPLPGGITSDREPSAFADSEQNLWLFWSAGQNGRWHIRYNKFAFTEADWGWKAAGKPLTTGPNSDHEPAALFFSAADPARQIWVFWSRKTRQGWNIHLATKPDRDFDHDNWSFESPFLPAPPLTTDPRIPLRHEYDNKEAAAGRDSRGNLWLFWSSNRKDGWNIYCRMFDAAAGAWGKEAAATKGYFSKKYPVFWEDERENIRLVFRSNESVAYASKVYPTTINYDHRYTGATTVDIHNTAKNSLRGELADIRRYAYDTGKTNENWYAPDTIGIYLYPNTEREELIDRGKEVVKGVFNRFLPIQLRAVIITLPFVHEEFIYTYGRPEIRPQRLIGESFADEINIADFDRYSGLKDSALDQIPNWIRMHSWSIDFSDHRTVDFNAAIINTNYRSWHVGLGVEYN